jgi:hypothetical protein
VRSNDQLSGSASTVLIDPHLNPTVFRQQRLTLRSESLGLVAAPPVTVFGIRDGVVAQSRADLEVDAVFGRIVPELVSGTAWEKRHGVTRTDWPAVVSEAKRGAAAEDIDKLLLPGVEVRAGGELPWREPTLVDTERDGPGRFAQSPADTKRG